MAVGPSALPCAGAAPPQRPPPKPSLATVSLCSQHCPPSTAMPPRPRRGRPCACPRPSWHEIPTPIHIPSPDSHQTPSRPPPQSPHQPPHTRKSQSITRIPKITVQTKSPHTPYHSPSRKSPKSQFRQNPPKNPQNPCYNNKSVQVFSPCTALPTIHHRRLSSRTTRYTRIPGVTHNVQNPL